ncbi:type IIL restriction-modification enzyme MmeI [Bosea vestrisii]|uniref:type IIL restriction-modification enzyme MmeI n=1 Tax=Bosea vestrisii TaxID=151416 RepID=UPI003265BA18
MINSDLSIGVDITQTTGLLANEGLCSPGVKLHGAGFIVTPAEAETLGLGTRPGLADHLRCYRNGRDLTARSRNVMAIDLFGLTAAQVRERFPEVYQHVKLRVKEEKDASGQVVGRDVNNRASYRELWWLFGEPRKELRPALAGLQRYIATVETTKHRVFQFLDASILPDNMLVAVALSDAFHLGVLSSRVHCVWALQAGGWLGIGNDPRYSKSRCFDPFPFPEIAEMQKQAIREPAEALDVLRKEVLERHPDLTLTKLYNVREAILAGRPLSSAEGDIRDRGLVLILNEHHEAIDTAVATAYGLPANADDETILALLVALNRDRAREEERGARRWLRPDYQRPRFGREAAVSEQIEAAELLSLPVPGGGTPIFPIQPVERVAAVLAILAVSHAPLDADAIALRFRQGLRVRPAVRAILVSLARVGEVWTGDGGASFVRRFLATG